MKPDEMKHFVRQVGDSLRPAQGPLLDTQRGVVNELRVIRLYAELAREAARADDCPSATMHADRVMRSLSYLIAALDVPRG